jgi:hypothetical protein
VRRVVAAIDSAAWRSAAVLACLGCFVIGAMAHPDAQNASPGTGTLYLGTFKGSITEIDEATGKVTHEISLANGMPTRLVLSKDRSRFYALDATFQRVEIVDRVKRTKIDSFTLSEGPARTRIWNLEPDPSDKYLVLTTKTATLRPDRWEIGPATLVQYDLADKKIIRTIPWPKGEEQERAGILFSPDGTLMYLLGDEVVIFETKTFTEVDRWDLARPLEPGAGRVNLGSLAPIEEEPGVFIGLFTMQDPVQNRRMMGIGRIELAKKRVEFEPIGPARPMAFSIAPDLKRGYGLLQDIGEYELWTFDVGARRVLARTPFRGRPRMALRVSGNGNVIYIYQAGNTIDLHDAATFRRLRTITLDGDMTTPLLRVPAAKPVASR